MLCSQRWVGIQISEEGISGHSWPRENRQSCWMNRATARAREHGDETCSGAWKAVVERENQRMGGGEIEKGKRGLKTMQREKFQQLNRGSHLLLISKACSLTYMRGDKGPVMKP